MDARPKWWHERNKREKGWGNFNFSPWPRYLSCTTKCLSSSSCHGRWRFACTEWENENREREREKSNGGKRSRNCEISWLLELQTLCPSFKSKRLVSCYGCKQHTPPVGQLWLARALKPRLLLSTSCLKRAFSPPFLLSDIKRERVLSAVAFSASTSSCTWHTWVRIRLSLIPIASYAPFYGNRACTEVVHRFRTIFSKVRSSFSNPRSEISPSFTLKRVNFNLAANYSREIDVQLRCSRDLRVSPTFI